MPVIPRHMSKSAKTGVASFVEPALGAGVDKNGAPVFVAPLDVRIEDIILIPLDDAVCALGEDSAWSFVNRPVPGGPSEDIRVIDFFEPATAVITSQNDGGTATVITVRATQAPRVFAGEAGNGLRIVFAEDNVAATGDIDYDPVTRTITLIIDNDGTPGTGSLTGAQAETLLEGLTIDAETDHLDVTVTTAGDDFTIADDVLGGTEVVLAGGQDEFPADGEAYHVLSEDIIENRDLPRGGHLEIAIANDGAATPATFVQIVYSIAQEL